MRINGRRFLAVIAAAMLISGPARAQNGTAELLKFLPDSTNALVVVDLAGLKLSPLGVKENWAQKQEQRYLAGVSTFPPLANRFVMGALLELSSMQCEWAIGVARMERSMPINAVARAEAAPPDELSGYQIALSPRNAYFVGLAPNLVAAYSPANRQHLGRWLRFAKANGGVAISPYLVAAARPSEPAQVVMAIDLTDGVDASRVRRALSASKALGSRPGVDPADVAKVIATIQGLRFYVRVDNQIEGQLTADFGGSIQPIRDLAKPLLLEALANNGLYLPELDDWKPLLTERSVTLSGPLSLKSMRDLATLIQTPVPAAAAAPTEIGGQPVQGQIENRQVNPAIAPSQNYFNAVNTVVADLRGQQGDTKKMATWFSRCSQQLDQLPILNVDPELVNYGADVSQKLRAMGLMLPGVHIENKYLQKNREQAYGGLRQIVGYAPGSWDPYGGYGYNNGYGGGGPDYGPAIAAGANNIIAMKAAQDTMIIRSKYARDQLWAEIDTATAQMRRMLVTKYQTNF